MREKPIIGWREWVALPELGIASLKAKVDTGARTSALHAFFVEPFRAFGRQRVRFGVHPYQGHTNAQAQCIADVIDERDVADSGGHRERRIVIATSIVLGDQSWVVEITLTARDTMRFRMLLGRTAIRGHFFVDPERSFRAGRPAQTTLQQVNGSTLSKKACSEEE